MAMILEPSNPSTLAVLVWRWLTDADPILQAQGSAAAIALLVMLVAAVAGSRQLWHLARRIRWYPTGRRASIGQPSTPWLCQPLFVVGYLVVAILLVWSLAGAWFFPAIWPHNLSLEGWRQAHFRPFATSLWLGGWSA
jgi:putative thiamine transport system permease protein